MPDDYKISDLTTAGAITNNDLVELSAVNTSSPSGYSSVKATMTQLGNKLANDLQYSADLQTTAKTLVGAINEVASGSSVDMPVKSASGNPCTFTTDLTDNLISVKANIVASGGGGTPSVPIPINGYTGGNITRCGVNLWDEEWEIGAFVGTTVNSKNFIKVTPSSTLFLKSPYAIVIIQYDYTKTEISRSVRPSNSVWTLGDNTQYIKLYLSSDYGTTYNNDVSINYPATDTSYHAYNGQTYAISFGQTVYGGVLDVTNGKLTVTHISIDLGLITWTLITGDGYWFFYSELVDGAIPNGELLSEKYEPISYGSIGFSDNKIAVSETALYVRTDITSTQPSGEAVYELATPFDIDLTPTAIQALSGVNNITSDLGGNLEVDYASGELAQGISKMIEAILHGGGGASILDGTTSPTSSQGSNGQIYLKLLPDLSSINIRESISNSAVGAYFDTGYYYNANTRIEMKVNLSGGATYPSFFGTRADTSGRGTQQMFIATYGTRAYYAFGCVEVYTDDFFSLNTDVLFKTQGRLLNRVQGGATKEMVTNAYENTPVASIYLFAANQNGAPWTDSYCIMTFYYCKIFEGDTLVHYYLPALDGSDVPCLYDCITGDYIYNSGTGTLTVGNAATIEKSITNAYAKVNGAWQDLIGTDIDDIDGIS